MTPEARAALVADLRRVLGEDEVSVRSLDRHARAHDASHYLLIPEVVATVETAAQMAAVLPLARAHGAPVTFRSGGTSLSGQGSGAGLLIDTRRGFRRVEVLEDGARVRVQPGATLRSVNARLARHGRALGPDPASEAAATLGGVIANNSSGMAAGVTANPARTVESMTVVLSSGTVVDTADPGAEALLAAREPALLDALRELRDRVRADPACRDEIARRFAMKNTMGYALDALCEVDEPAALLARLLIGSEGTLGFVAEAVLRTVPAPSHAATGLLVLESVEEAARALPELVASGASALELMDATSLAVARRDPAVPAALTGFDLDRHAALLVEYRGEDAADLEERVAAAEPVLAAVPATRSARLTRDPAERAALWAVRKGLYASVAGARPAGTTAMLEDVVVPVEHLAAACRDLAALLAGHGYADAVIFGHAKDGNLHFMVTEQMEDPGAVERLAAFTEDLVDLVLRHGGNLKAEHGTGRAMAPFIDRQYSPALVEVLWAIKDAFDPAGVLNPGVVLTRDPRAHLRDLKPVDTVEEEVDRCVECGYCEPVCPSRDLTLTPRQRIVARRARARAAAEGDDALVAELDAQQRYASLETCAADGMCQTACPVGIDTGALVKRLRGEQHGRLESAGWARAAAHWGPATAAAGRALDVAARVPAAAVTAPNRAARRVLGADTIPLWTEDLPGGGTRRSTLAALSQPRPATPDGAPAPAAIFLPSCQGAMFAPAPGSAGAQSAVATLCAAAGVELRVPEGIDSLCCGTPWSSKGFAAGHAAMAERVLEAVAAAQPSSGPALPVVVDATSCTEGVAGIMRRAQEAGDARAATVVDAVTLVVREVLPRVRADPGRRVDSLVLHPTCSSTRGGVTADLEALARAVAAEVEIPLDWGCCGFAGDRGMLHPELTAAATRAEAAEVAAIDAAAHASCNRACEIALSRATGQDYRHLLEVAAQVIAP